MLAGHLEELTHCRFAAIAKIGGLYGVARFVEGHQRAVSSFEQVNGVPSCALTDDDRLSHVEIDHLARRARTEALFDFLCQ